MALHNPQVSMLTCVCKYKCNLLIYTCIACEGHLSVAAHSGDRIVPCASHTIRDDPVAQAQPHLSDAQVRLSPL